MEPASPSNRWHYNRFLLPMARDLRRHPTRCEKIMWNLILRDGKMKGLKFTRQRPVLNFIADFMCKEKLVIIEVDGISHWPEEAQKKDARRTKLLNEAGFTVIRYSDSEVLFRLEEVKEDLEKKLEELV